MLSHRALQRTACATCRLRQAIAVKQLARTRKPIAFGPALAPDFAASRQTTWQTSRSFSLSVRQLKSKKNKRRGSEELEGQAFSGLGGKTVDAELVLPPDGGNGDGVAAGNVDMEEMRATATKVVENLRQVWGEYLPVGIFDSEFADVFGFEGLYEELYGEAKFFEPFEDKESLTEDQVQSLEDHGVSEEDAVLLEQDMEAGELADAVKARRVCVEGGKVVMEQHEGADEFWAGMEKLFQELEPYGVKTRVLAAKDVFEDFGGFPAQLLGHRERRLWRRLYGSVETFEYPEEEVDEHVVEDEGEEALVDMEGMPAFDDARLAEDIKRATADDEAGDANYVDSGSDPETRAHPLTAAGRSGTSPSTLYLPKANLVEPLQAMLSGVSKVHLSEAAHRIFGGVGLPYSTSTPALAKTMQAKPIPLEPSQGRMSDIEGDAFLAVLMPAMYATITSVLVETRKRLGTAWAENLVRKAEAGDLKILDAGGAGVGVLAVRELLRAEWERMHEQADEELSGMAIAEADGKLGGSGLSPPLGNAVVLTGSDALRHRSSQLLENTTFIPRIPDYVHTETAKQSGKFDIVIAPHTIYPIREDFARRTHIENLWALLNADGGVLMLLEKGIPRGFEAIAAAREHLLNTRIASPGTEELSSANIQDPDIDWEDGGPSRTKDHGMIIAPCTNHTSCPMYTGANKGTIKGRKDICHFEQRYIRPDFLQKIVNARDKNFEDVKFSYLSVMRGRDLRRFNPDRVFADQPLAQQGPAQTDLAFAGYESSTPTSETIPSTLSLPRQILPPLKRTGHVTMDLCTPSGTLERWTIPKSFSKQAYRDARKTSWGDLWALGAKTRVLRQARGGDKKKRGESKGKEGDDGGEEEGRVARKPLGKRKVKEKRRGKERRAGKQGVLLSREAF